MPTTLSIRWPSQRARSASMTLRKSSPCESTGVMSLKTMPGLGKSGTSRMAALTASSMEFSLSRQEQERVARPRPLAHLEVQVRPGGPPGLADPGHRLAAPHRRPLRHQDLAAVGVDRHQPVVVAQDDDGAVA